MMTIKNSGGIFNRNPTFNDVTVDGTLTVDQIVEKTETTGITLDGVTLKDGNVVLTNGKGIDFSATSGTGTSELFDDYEEGTWTPILRGEAAGSVSLTSGAGLYTKLGRLVKFSAFVTGTFDLTGVTGVLNLGGLPFSLDQWDGGGTMTYSNNLFSFDTVDTTVLMRPLGGTNMRLSKGSSGTWIYGYGADMNSGTISFMTEGWGIAV